MGSGIPAFPAFQILLFPRFPLILFSPHCFSPFLFLLFLAPLFLRRFFAAESGEKRRPDPAGGPGRFP